GVSKLVTLGGPLPAITDDLTIIGNYGSGPVTVSGANTHQIFRVNNGKKLNLQTILIGNGVGASCGAGIICGGGLFNDGGIVDIYFSYFFNNHADDGFGGAIYNSGGTVEIKLSDFQINHAAAGSGGAIYNHSGTVNIHDSNFLRHNAGHGGAITNQAGTMLVNGSLFVENSANGAISGDSNGGIGGAILNSGGMLTVANSTFSGNTAANGFGGGALYNGGSSTLTVVNSTLANNDVTNPISGTTWGGGVSNWGTLSLVNSIVANNTGGDCVNQSSANGHHNLIQDGSHACGLTNGANDNKIGVDPKLDALPAWGTEGYRTIAPLTGSPALDAGDDVVCAATPINNLDQRGTTRPQGAHCDMGAFELIVTPNIVVTSNEDHAPDGCTPVGGIGVGFRDCTLREAIMLANTTPGQDTITFSARFNTYPSNIITLNEPLPAIEDNVTIDGVGTGLEANTVLISGANRYQIFTVNADKELNLQNNLGLANGVGGLCSFSNTGGAVCNHGVLRVSHVSFYTNSAAEDGGAIANFGELFINDSAGFYSNVASTSGGSLFNSGYARIENTVFDNSSAADGGAIMNFGRLVILNSTFQGNTANTGGAIRDGSGSTVDVSNSTFANNLADNGYGGGGIYMGSCCATLTLINSTFSNNSATGGLAGGINNWGPMHLANSIIANSTSGGDCVSNGATTGSHNLIEDTGSACGFSNGTDGNIIGSDPKLGPLTWSGGLGGTQTLTPLAGSPALNAGNDATCAAAPVNNLDQRGITRPQGAHCDIGSYESQNAALA
ncbi:MAG: hypothetical protein KDE58_28745, partial [Caldilineaceae bacterium]|nr:hypothetical protein [Caldilineaceae bacterium]